MEVEIELDQVASRLYKCCSRKARRLFGSSEILFLYERLCR